MERRRWSRDTCEVEWTGFMSEWKCFPHTNCNHSLNVYLSPGTHSSRTGSPYLAPVPGMKEALSEHLLNK